jgi:Fe2+ or Zn2+ uptake regulation protein
MTQRSHYRTPNRRLILRTINGRSLSVKLIHSQLTEQFEAGKLERVPRLNQIYRTVSDLRKSRFVVGNKKGRVTYYKRV